MSVLENQLDIPKRPLPGFTAAASIYDEDKTKAYGRLNNSYKTEQSILPVHYQTPWCQGCLSRCLPDCPEDCKGNKWCLTNCENECHTICCHWWVP
jgi:hypothetical protein